MRVLPAPNVDDHAILTKLISNRRLKHRAALASVEGDTRAQYDDYAAHRGDPWTVAPNNSCQLQATAFRALYERPPKALSFIAGMRGMEGACPVCGGDRPATLDHYLPQGSYAEFSFYASNLVPACSRCNTVRQAKLKGVVAGQRPVHPYFDNHGATAAIEIRLVAPFEDPRFDVTQIGRAHV